MADWPKKGDKAFVDGPLAADLTFLFVTGLDRAYIASFKKAADIVVGSLGRLPEYERDELFYSVGYLYRHALELQMKYILHLAKQMNIVPELPEAANEHALHPLWNETRKVLSAVWDDDAKILNPIEAIIQDIHKVDPSGQEFRYATRTDQKASLRNLPSKVSLLKLQTAVSGIYEFLEGCAGGMEAALDGMIQNMQ